MSGHTFTRLGEGLTSAFDRSCLKEKVGRSMSVLDVGFVRMAARLAERGVSVANIDLAKDRALEGFRAGEAACESPIERAVLAGLLTSDWRSDAETIPAVVTREAQARPERELVIVPQFVFVRCRADFGISARVGDSGRLWAVECDGADYHRDALAQRKRDAFLNSWGIQVYHLTGSDIHRDVHTALSQVVHDVNAWRAAQ